MNLTTYPETIREFEVPKQLNKLISCLFIGRYRGHQYAPKTEKCTCTPIRPRTCIVTLTLSFTVLSI